MQTYTFSSDDRGRLLSHWGEDPQLLWSSLVRYVSNFGLKEAQDVSFYTSEGVCEELAKHWPAQAQAQAQGTMYMTILEATLRRPPGAWLLFIQIWTLIDLVIQSKRMKCTGWGNLWSKNFE